MKKERMFGRRIIGRWSTFIMLGAWTVVSVIPLISDPSAGVRLQGDALVYRSGGEELWAGRPLYDGPIDLNFVPGQMNFTYPPIGAMILSPIHLLNVYASTFLIVFLSVIALFYVVLCCSRVLCAEIPFVHIWSVVNVILLMEPVRTHLALGQINIFLLAMVVTDFFLFKGTRWHGILIGLAIAIKLTPAVLLLYLVLSRQWGPLFRVMLSVGFFTGIGWLIRPRDSAQYWGEAVRDPGNVGALYSLANQSLRGVVERLVAGPMGGFLWLVLVGISITLVALVMHVCIWQGDRYLAIAINCTIGLLISPISWTHHWVWALPLLMYLVQGARKIGVSSVPAQLLGAISVMGLLSWSDYFEQPVTNPLDEQWSLWVSILAGGYVYWLLWTIVWLCLRAGAFDDIRRQVSYLVAFRSPIPMEANPPSMGFLDENGKN